MNEKTQKTQKTEKSGKVERFMQGIVLSAKSEKTIAVSVERVFQHPVYKKIIRRKTKYLVHDEEKKCHPGDIVRVRMVRPISKRKRWIVTEIVTAARKDEVLHDSNAD